MVMEWFSSDFHFGHKNVIEYCDRPFDSVQQMDEKLLDNWNALVRPDDTAYLLGDLFFYNVNKSIAILERMNGKKHLIFGNHDKNLRKSEKLLAHFITYGDYKEVTVQHEAQDYKLVMSHYPMIVWNRSHRGSIMLHGHSHGSLTYPFPDARIMDVGVDCNNFVPVSTAAVIERMRNKTGTVVDHHGGDL